MRQGVRGQGRDDAGPGRPRCLGSSEDPRDWGGERPRPGEREAEAVLVLEKQENVEKHKKEK